VESYEKYYNRGFITYRKAVTEAGQFAALEWSGRGSLLHDLLGRAHRASPRDHVCEMRLALALLRLRRIDF